MTGNKPSVRATSFQERADFTVWRHRLPAEASTAQTVASCCSTEIHGSNQFFCFDRQRLEEYQAALKEIKSVPEGPYA
jgi:hypothetical protein